MSDAGLREGTEQGAGAPITGAGGTLGQHRTAVIPPPLPADVVAIALIDATVDFCEGTDVQYEVIASSKLFSNRLLDFQVESEFLGQSDYQVCVRNDFSVPVQIDATIETVVSDELSGCPDQYEAGAGDTTCDTGQGELGNEELSVGFAPSRLASIVSPTPALTVFASQTSSRLPLSRRARSMWGS